MWTASGSVAPHFSSHSTVSESDGIDVALWRRSSNGLAEKQISPDSYLACSLRVRKKSFHLEPFAFETLHAHDFVVERWRVKPV